MPNEASMDETVGERIRRIRQKRGFRTTELASRVGYSEAAIKKIEGNRSGSPSFENGLRIADALGIDPHELAFGEREERADLLVDLPGGGQMRVEIKAGTGSGKTEQYIAAMLAARLPAFLPALLSEAEGASPFVQSASEPIAVETTTMSRKGEAVAADLAELIHTLAVETKALRSRIETLEQGRRKRA